MLTTYWPSPVGGMLIGLCSGMLLVVNGRVAGISGIVGHLVGRWSSDTAWRGVFLIGLICGPVVLVMTGHRPAVQILASAPVLVAAGVLVGFGTRLRSGCTSGHGVSGIARLSPRSFAAVATFLGTAALLFGVGLAMSDMLNPARVLGFLDVAGAWDRSLAFVLGGAVCVAALGTIIAGRLHHPLLTEAFDLPKSRRIDVWLIGGSALFGIGWGLAGFCPGPAVAALSLGLLKVFLFVGALLAGVVLFKAIPMPRSDAVRVHRQPIT